MALPPSLWTPSVWCDCEAVAADNRYSKILCWRTPAEVFRGTTELITTAQC